MNECDCLSAKFNRADSFSASIVSYKAVSASIVSYKAVSASIVSYKAVSAALEKADETTAIIMHVKNTHSRFYLYATPSVVWVVANEQKQITVSSNVDWTIK